MNRTVTTTQVRITENGKKKKVGFLEVSEYSGSVFVTNRNIEKHLFRKYDGWALDKLLVDRVLIPRGAKIKIVSYMEDVIYEIHVSDFIKHAIPIDYHEHRPQYCVSREFFKRND